MEHTFEIDSTEGEAIHHEDHGSRVFDYDANCGIEDADSQVNILLGLIEDQRTGLLRYDDEVIATLAEDGLIFDEETEYGYIVYVEVGA